MAAAARCRDYYNKLIGVKGFLGQFQVSVEVLSSDGAAELSLVSIRKPHFDIVSI